MTGDQVPLCDQHYAPMLRTRGLPLIFHGCTEDKSCKRRYHPSFGYYGGRNPTMTYDRVLCHTHFKALYVCVYDAQREIRRYACPVQGCKNVTEWLPSRPDVQLDSTVKP
jgi:hypothetical protein